MGVILSIEVMPIDRELQPEEVGFDYAQAVREVNHAGWSYARIANFCGYRSRQSITNLLDGDVPSHLQGERLYILYVEVIGRKPPPRKVNQNGQGVPT